METLKTKISKDISQQSTMTTTPETNYEYQLSPFGAIKADPHRYAKDTYESGLVENVNKIAELWHMEYEKNGEISNRYHLVYMLMKPTHETLEGQLYGKRKQELAGVENLGKPIQFFLSMGFILTCKIADSKLMKYIDLGNGMLKICDAMAWGAVNERFVFFSGRTEVQNIHCYCRQLDLSSVEDAIRQELKERIDETTQATRAGVAEKMMKDLNLYQYEKNLDYRWFWNTYKEKEDDYIKFLKERTFQPGLEKDKIQDTAEAITNNQSRFLDEFFQAAYDKWMALEKSGTPYGETNHRQHKTVRDIKIKGKKNTKKKKSLKHLKKIK